MKSFRCFGPQIFLLFCFVVVSHACGPIFPEAVFVQRTRPDGNYADYVKGRLGVPQAGYRIRHLVVAYDWLNGSGLIANEQQQALILDTTLNRRDRTENPVSARSVAINGWFLARQASVMPGNSESDRPVAQNLQKSMPADADSIQTDRAVPGDDYETFPNCLEDTFASAARTLNARKAIHAKEPAAIFDWVQGQDAVFTNCDGQGDTTPPEEAATAPLWLRQDRAYQRAAASFYQTDYDAAIGQLKIIAQDKGSQWRQTALLVIARAMIRRATIGQITELPAGAQGPRNSTYSKSRSDALTAYQDHLAAMQPARFAEARDVLRSILADSAMASLHHSALGLLDLVELKAHPAAQARVLEQRLTARDRSGPSGTFRQALIDLSYYVRQFGAGPVTVEHNYPSASGPGLLAWVQAIAPAGTGAETDPLVVSSKKNENKPAGRVYTARDSFDVWRTTHATPWLIAALMAAQPGAPEVPELLEAVNELPHASSAFMAATYQRMRLEGGGPKARSELDQLMSTILSTQSRSTINLFLELHERSSPTLSAFLADVGKLPAGVIYDTGDPLDLQTSSRDGLCHLSASEAETRLFDHDAATVLNTRMPLTLLADAAEGQILPINLRFQVAQATWTRALLLGQPQIAKRMSSILGGCYPAWWPWLRRYDLSIQEEDRTANGLLAMMRFASSEPIVRDGAQRNEGFAVFSSYRDNWWQESKAAGSPPIFTEQRSGRSFQAETFFGSTPAPPAELPDPPFLTSADRVQATVEIARLRTIPCASDYFADAALSWQEQHPKDPRTLDILGFAERVVRAGCRTSKTKELNHRLFTLVQTRYPKSRWAIQYRTWE